MHAAYKGKADMCRLLLQHGADVNCNQHEYGYTALMFAGLSGITICTLSSAASIVRILISFYEFNLKYNSIKKSFYLRSMIVIAM